MDKIVKQFLSQVSQKNQNEPEFMQAVTEVAETVIPYIVSQDIYYGQNILLRMVEPERVVSFRVAWIDDNEEIQVNRGYRIEMNSAIGPYKGGLRFHPSVNLSILKFLAFLDVFKILKFFGVFQTFLGAWAVLLVVFAVPICCVFYCGDGSWVQ